MGMKPCSKNCQCQIFHQETLDAVKKTFYEEKEFIKISDLFKIFNDPSRLKILEAIKVHDLCVCDLASLLGVSKSAVSHQMTFLKRYDLVQSKKEGKMVYYRLVNQEIGKMIHQAYELVKGMAM
jgi:DNA-binding transcriptional ArsR family regulator